MCAKLTNDFHSVYSSKARNSTSNLVLSVFRFWEKSHGFIVFTMVFYLFLYFAINYFEKLSVFLYIDWYLGIMVYINVLVLHLFILYVKLCNTYLRFWLNCDTTLYFQNNWKSGICELFTITRKMIMQN